MMCMLLSYKLLSLTICLIFSNLKVNHIQTLYQRIEWIPVLIIFYVTVQHMHSQTNSINNRISSLIRVVMYMCYMHA